MSEDHKTHLPAGFGDACKHAFFSPCIHDNKVYLAYFFESSHSDYVVRTCDRCKRRLEHRGLPVFFFYYRLHDRLWDLTPHYPFTKILAVLLAAVGFLFTGILVAIAVEALRYTVTGKTPLDQYKA